jgi:hypothetical protein
MTVITSDLVVASVLKLTEALVTLFSPNKGAAIIKHATRILKNFFIIVVFIVFTVVSFYLSD